MIAIGLDTNYNFIQHQAFLFFPFLVDYERANKRLLEQFEIKKIPSFSEDS